MANICHMLQLSALLAPLSCGLAAAESIDLNGGLVVGLPSEFKVDFGNKAEVLDGLGSSAVGDLSDISKWFVVPDVEGLEPDVKTVVQGLIDSGLCEACYQPGYIDYPTKTNVPGAGVGTSLPCVGDDPLKCLPIGSSAALVSDLTGMYWGQTELYDGKGYTTGLVGETNEVVSAVKKLLTQKALALGSECEAPFFGDIRTRTDLLGNSIEVDIVAASESFSSERTDLWIRFTFTVQLDRSILAWEAGAVARRLFLIDHVFFSRRGVCLPLVASGAPVPDAVTGSFDDANYRAVEQEIRDSIQASLTFSSDAWLNLIK